MTQFNLMQKLKIFLDVIYQTKYHWAFLTLLVVIGISLFWINQRNNKIYKIIYILILLALIGFLFINYQSSLSKIFEYMMSNFFIALFFPNIGIYLAALIILNIILWISVLNVKSSRIIRITNTIVFLIMNYFLFLIINIIQNEKLDVYDQSSLYQNDGIRILIEWSSIIFIIWLIFLLIYRLILLYLGEPKEFVLETMPKDYKIIESPRKVLIHKKEKEEKEEIVPELSLEDYKLFSQLLKESKEKQKTIKKDTKYKAMDNKKSEEIFGPGTKDEENDQRLYVEYEFVEKEDVPIKNNHKTKEKEKMTELEILYQNINY